ENPIERVVHEGVRSLSAFQRAEGPARAPPEPDRPRAARDWGKAAVHRTSRDAPHSLALRIELPLVDDVGPCDRELQPDVVARAGRERRRWHDRGVVTLVDLRHDRN